MSTKTALYLLPLLLLLLMNTGIRAQHGTGGQGTLSGDHPSAHSGTHTNDLPTIVINEIQASNNATLADEDGDFETWIELFNTGVDTVDVGWFGLSDDYGRPFRWVIPPGTRIAPGDFLLIWASGKNRVTPGQPLHTNFSIAREGEEVILTTFQGLRVDEVPPTPIPSDISYGRYPDGSGSWHFFREPTPNASNESSHGYGEILQKPQASVSGGFHTSLVEVTLSNHPVYGEIRYTLDGSEPGPDSPLYQKPIKIPDRSDDPNDLSEIMEISHRYAPAAPPRENVYKGTPLRAKAFRDGDIASPVMTETYFYHQTGADRYTFPVVTITTDRDNLFDHKDGIYVLGRVHENWIKDGGSNFNGGAPANYNQRDPAWERPAHFALYEVDGSEAVSQDIGIRIHGGWSRAFPQKSFRLYSRSDYGESRFRYRFFPELELDDFNRLILRQSGQDVASTMFRDVFIQESVKHMNFDIQHFRPVVVFLNGEYWGIYNIRQRYDRHYFETHYQVGPDDLDLLTASANNPKEGENADYLALRTYIRDHDLSDPAHYDYVKERIDTDNYIDYYVAQIHNANSDWPHNNIDFWRMNHGEYRPDAPLPEQDGRWRWMMFDTDFGYGYYSSVSDNTLDFVTGSGRNPWSNLVFDGLMDNRDFRDRFYNRFADLLNTGLHPKRLNALLDSLQSIYAPEIGEHIRRHGYEKGGAWYYPGNVDEWIGKVNAMRAFAEKRPDLLWRHLKSFDDRDTTSITLNVTDPEGGYITINTTPLTPATPGVDADPWPWTGTYFEQIPVQLKANPNPGYEFVQWIEIPPEQEADPSDGSDTKPGIGFDTGLVVIHSTTYSQDETTTVTLSGPMHLVAEFRATGTASGTGPDKPEAFALHQNYPNPFNPQTTIVFSLPESARVRLDVYDITGRHVTRLINENRPAGQYRTTFDSSQQGSLASGIYLYRLDAGTFSATKKMTLIK